MPRDYKYRANAGRKKKSGGAPPWLWMLVGLVLGAFIVGLVWLKLESPPPASEWIGDQPERPPKAVPRETTTPEIPPYEPRYRFYDELGRKQVVVPEEQLDRRESREQIDPTARYLVQIGSFARPADADRLQAELALQGIETRIARVSLEGGRERYRVQAGPFLGRSELDAARRQLKQAGQGDLLVRIFK